MTARFPRNDGKKKPTDYSRPDDNSGKKEDTRKKYKDEDTETYDIGQTSIDEAVEADYFD